MQQFTLRNVTSQEELIASDALLQSTYQLLFNFDYPGLRRELKTSYPSSVLSLFNAQESVVSTLAISHKSSNNTLPSEDIFGYCLPDFLKDSLNVVEIGKLAKKLKSTPVFADSEKMHFELISLLQGVMVYAQENGLEYWTATLHPVFAQILKEINFPFHVLHEGVIAVTEKNKKQLAFTGNYGTSKLIYAYYSMEESINAISKWDLSNLTKMDLNYENYV